MDRKVKQFIFDILSDCFLFMQEPLSNYSYFTQSLSRQLQIKEGGNVQFSFDVDLDLRIKKSLIRHNITGSVFSEESKWYEVTGEKHYKVVYDPFCNSSLAARTFREGALGISIFSYDYMFICSAILDFQTGLTAIADDRKTKFYQIQNSVEFIPQIITIDKLSDAWIVFTLENIDERKYMNEENKVFKEAKRIIISSGHIYWLKLAAGFVDGYMDPFGGEHLYEMFAATISQKAGCIVTNKDGVDFDAAKYLKTFENDSNFIYYPIAARSKQLHRQLLTALRLN